MGRCRIEITVGFFILIGILSFAYLAVRFAQMEIIGGNNYEVFAKFNSVSGLKTGANVEIAGVTVGRVSDILLNDYEAVVKMKLDSSVILQEDSIASVHTRGIIGDKYINILPGASEAIIRAGGRIFETESAIDLEELISKYIFTKKG